MKNDIRIRLNNIKNHIVTFREKPILDARQSNLRFALFTLIGIDLSKEKISGSMFSDSGIKLSLEEILGMIPDNCWQWTIYEFDAIGLAPDGMTIPQFENLILSKDYGFNISWEDLKNLAESIFELNACMIAAVTDPVNYSSVIVHVDQTLAFITVSDSTNWEIIINKN